MDLMITSVVYLQAVSNKGKKVTVAVICLITERISSWIAFMDFSLGALEEPRYTVLYAHSYLHWSGKKQSL